MSIDLTFWVALVSGTLLAIWGLPVPRARFWLTWGGSLAALYLLGYFALGASAGLLGYLIGTLLHWKPTDSALINGIIFAVGGHALVRANGAQFNASEANEAGSLLGLGTRWFEDLLNNLSESRVSKWLQEKDEVDIARLARQLLGRILGRYSLEDAKAAFSLSAEDARVAILLSARLEDLANEQDTARRDVALNALIQFCKEEYCARNLPRS